MSAEPEYAIRAEALVKRWGDTLAVGGVDLAVEPGEVVALLGPNGAGKSSTIDLLLGLAAPGPGPVRIWGRSPVDACRAGRVGALMQTGGLLGAVTVRELVDMVRGISPHPLPADEVLALAGIGEIAGQRADRLSGGQTQRVRFAVAIAGDPDLLVLDEPTVAMDVSTRRAFWATMREWTGRGRTVLFATHYLEEADAFADRAVLMARGRIVADGPVAEIKTRVGGRVIRASLPDADLTALAGLPGVTTVERQGAAVLLHCADSDTALRALLAGHPAAHDIEIAGVGLEDAFLALTGEPAQSPPPPAAPRPMEVAR